MEANSSEVPAQNRFSWSNVTEETTTFGGSCDCAEKQFDALEEAKC